MVSRQRKTVVKEMIDESEADDGVGQEKSRNWVRVIFSVPRNGPPTNVAKFSEISGYLYTVLGVLMTSVPGLWRLVLMLPEFEGRSEAYIRVAGMALSVLGFLYSVGGRANIQSPGQGHLLVTIPERLLLVNGALIMMYSRGMVNIMFSMAFILLDSALAVITFILWWRETEGASIGKFFLDLWKGLSPHKDETRNSSVIVQVNGAFYMTSGLLFMIHPDLLQSSLSLDPFLSFADGYLSSYFLLITIYGVIFVFSGRSNYPAFNTAVVFYRVFVSVPFFVVMLFLNQIEMSFALAVCSVDLVFSFFTFLCLLREGV